VGEPVGEPFVYGADRLFLSDRPLDRLVDAGHPVVALSVGPTEAEIGYAVVTLEIATALAGAALGVQPFDQPDVAAAKTATTAVLEAGGAVVPITPLDDLLALVEPGDHLALQVFGDPGDHEAHVLEGVRVALRDRLHVAVSLGFGPRFLHSTGQLHKGGPRSVVCIQAVGEDTVEVDIPGQPFGFGHLMHAQAAGDRRTLQERGIRAGRVELEELLAVAP
jgi:hypothetical protein